MEAWAWAPAIAGSFEVAPGMFPCAPVICGIPAAPALPAGVVAAVAGLADGGAGGADPPQPTSTIPTKPLTHNFAATEWRLDVFIIDVVLKFW